MHSMAGPRSRRLLFVAVFAMALLVLVFLQILYGDVSWDNVSQKVPWMSRLKSCPTCPLSAVSRQTPGHLHYLIAGSKSNKQLCRALVSSTASRYGAPVISGWEGTGELDAAKTHLAKVRVAAKYLEALPPDADDDLFLMIDGYDVHMQLGPEVLIERYFQVAEMEDDRLTQQLGPANVEAVAGPLGRHIFFGADKVCWPTDFRRPACWAVPMVPGMDDNMFGPGTDSGDNGLNRPRWLNSGTIMGPVKETRELFQATLNYVNATYDPASEVRESDQFYMAEIWGLQELDRIDAQRREDPRADHPKGPPDAHWPQLDPEEDHNRHVAVDYWSLLFQTWAGYTEYVDWRKFDGPSHGFRVEQNVRGEENFKPWNLPLAGDALRFLERVFRTTADDDGESLGSSVDDLVRGSQFGANVATKTTLPLFHCTGHKGVLDEFWPRMWFYPHAKALVRSAIRYFQANEPYAPWLINNRIWYPAMPYPDGVDLNDGGAWSDGSSDSGKIEWLSFDSLCEEHEAGLFGE